MFICDILYSNLIIKCLFVHILNFPTIFKNIVFLRLFPMFKLPSHFVVLSDEMHPALQSAAWGDQGEWGKRGENDRFNIHELNNLEEKLWPT